MHSHLYAKLLEVAVDDMEAGGIVTSVIDHWNRNPVDDAVALRLMGGVHRSVLSGGAPRLAAHYPSVGGEPTFPECGAAFIEAIREHVPELREGMQHPPQTNEVGRAGVLLGGLLEIARITGLPLRLLEFGASAGLNLQLDKFRYDFGAVGWGDPESPVRVDIPWRGTWPDPTTDLLITERAGCDAAPIDVGDPAQALRLVSFVWADQLVRFRRTEAAITLAQAAPVVIDRASASAWLAGRLAAPAAGVVTVVMHSAVVQYLGTEERRAVDTVWREASGRATPEAPIARLSFEPGQEHFDLRMRLAPRGVSSTLATAHPHGAWAEWYSGSPA